MDVSRTSSVLILIVYYYYYTTFNDWHGTSNMLMASYKLPLLTKFFNTAEAKKEVLRKQEVLLQALLVRSSVLK
jgi:hypothetical protein